MIENALRLNTLSIESIGNFSAHLIGYFKIKSKF